MHELPERSEQRRAQQLLVAPGAFKHSLSATSAAEAIARGLRASPLGLPVVLFPIADGGNGTLDAFMQHGGTVIRRVVRGPLGEPVEAALGILPGGETAVIEMALASGIELIERLNALGASTYGTGELICAALDAGVKRVIVGLGGSATTDGGAGCLQALGLRLTDQQGNVIRTGGGGLVELARIETSGLHPRLKEVEVIVAADVDIPAIGPGGSAEIFGPQKGALPHEVEVLDQSLAHWFNLTRLHTGIDVSTTPGGGAAGALAAGLMAYANATIQSGVDMLLDHTNFDAALETAALVITGEGRLDNQSLKGKGTIGVARRALARGIPVIALAGSFEWDPDAFRAAGIVTAWPIVEGVTTLPNALKNGAILLERAAYRLGCTLSLRLPAVIQS